MSEQAVKQTDKPKTKLKSLLILWFLTMLGIAVLSRLTFVSWVQNNLSVLTGIILIYVPILALWKKREKASFFESSLAQLAIGLFWFVGISIVIFPLLELANHQFQILVFKRQFIGGHFGPLGQLGQMGQIALTHLILIAFPEEFFYRGYLQPQLNKIWPKKWVLLGAPIGLSLFVTSFLFALSHSLIQIQWWHFSIFFPSLAFGWLRERTGAITASVLFHALSNMYSYWVALNYR